MKRSLATLPSFAVFALLGTLSWSSMAWGQTPATVKRPAIRVLRLSGTPRERGLEHGRSMRTEIHALIAKWKKELQKGYKMDPDEFIRRFAANTSFEKTIDKWTPGLLDEVRGIAKGAGIDYRTMYVYQLIDETWAQGHLVKSQEVHKCTSIGVSKTKNHPTIVAQNLDIPRWYHGHQTLLHITNKKSGLQSFVVTIPGLVGANGMNSARVGVCVNTLMQLAPSADGLPVAFVVRGLLQRKTSEDAKLFLKQVKHASGQNYLIGGPEHARTFECSAAEVVQFTPFQDAGHTWHTNFPAINDDYNKGMFAYAKKRGQDPIARMRSCPRFKLLEKILAKGTDVDFDVIVKALGSKDSRVPICNSSTFACTIMQLGPKPRLHFSAGGSDKNAFRIFEFDNTNRKETAEKPPRVAPGK
jgi:isopenicillin-N N-acyltransferase like protein